MSATSTRLDGPQIYLETPGAEHLPAIMKIYLDAPEYFEAVTGTSDFDPTDVEMMYEDAIVDESRFYFAVRRVDSKALIGTIEVETGSDDIPAVLRGLVLAQTERGKGYGRASLELVQKFLMDEFAVGTITAEVPEGYDDGERFLEAMGYRKRRLKTGEFRWVKRLSPE